MDTPDFRKSVWNLRRSTMTDVKDPSDTGGRLIAASKVNGTSVYNTAGEKLGSVYDVMLDKSTGKTEYAIMSFGGFLGIGDSYHPLPWHSLTYDEAHGGYVVNRPFAFGRGAGLLGQRARHVGRSRLRPPYRRLLPRVTSGWIQFTRRPTAAAR
jgi:sporulation protein YlmC with PRC-barrel domain